ncbi:MAG: YsnF/AvaK domain-containing protein [Chloroflexi bacterium]|nr:YsnF/AvaK domain-containing protein [Chloroflexota bacterium]
MDTNRDFMLVTQDGRRGKILSPGVVHPGGDENVLVELENGRQILISEALLEKQADGSYSVPLNLAKLEDMSEMKSGQVIVIPVIAEHLEVTKREREKGTVRVEKKVHEKEQIVDQPVIKNRVDVRRKPVNKYIDKPLSAWYEGDTLVIPVQEEVLVIEKKLVLREEIRVTQQKTEVRQPRSYKLRREEVYVNRISSDAPAEEEEEFNIDEL